MEVRFLLSDSTEPWKPSPTTSPPSSSFVPSSSSSSSPSAPASSSASTPSASSSSSLSPSPYPSPPPLNPFSLPSPSSSPPSFPFPPLLPYPTSPSTILASSPPASPPSAIPSSSYPMFPRSFTTSWGSPPKTTPLGLVVAPPSGNSPPTRIQFSSSATQSPTVTSAPSQAALVRPLSCGPSPIGKNPIGTEWQQPHHNDSSPTTDSLLNLLANAALAPSEREDEKSPQQQRPHYHEQVSSPPLLKGHEIRLVTFPPEGELVARKTLKFSVMMTGDDGRLNGSIYIAVVLIEAKTLSPVSDGLIEKKPKPRNDTAAPRPPQDTIVQRIVPYRETSLEFQIVKGSAKKNIQNRVRFELRLYRKGGKSNSSYTILDTDHSPLYRILTHSSQLGRSSKQ